MISLAGGIMVDSNDPRFSFRKLIHAKGQIHEGPMLAEYDGQPNLLQRGLKTILKKADHRRYPERYFSAGNSRYESHWQAGRL